ncbi:hypothetical protein [Candidatus Uabimicrobium sp. HlEnr_7]|uniref:hypothetical protein n=1 Tax=Candidatus Uabimicrobium helgolandensis TaxID=3095367 RepID=UPI00355841EC
MRRGTVNLTPLIDVLFVILFVVIGSQSEVAETEIERGKKKHEQLNEQVDLMKRSKESLQQEITELKKVLADKDKVEKTLLTKLRSTIKNIAELEEQLANQDKISKELQEKHTSLQKELEKNKQFVTSLRKKIHEATSAKEKLNQKIEKLLSQQKVLLNEKNALAKNQKSLKNKIEDVEEELEKKKLELAKEIAERVKLKELLETERNLLKNSLKKLEEQKLDLDKDLKKLQQQIESFRSQIVDLEEEKTFLSKELESTRIEIKEKEESIRQNKLKVQEQKIFNSALQKQYDKMWQEFNKEFDNHNIVKIYQRAHILQKNYNIFEIVIKKDSQFKITHSGTTDVQKCNSQEELVKFLEEKVPRSVHIDPSRSIFLILMEPDSILNRRTWLEAELKKMKVIYDVHLLVKSE